MYDLAHWMVVLAFLASAGSVCASFLAARLASGRWSGLANGLAATALVSLTVAVVVLGYALVARDFRLAYVAAHTSSDLPARYALSALWAGQEGSLLFWTFLFAVLDGVFLCGGREELSRSRSAAQAVLAALVCFFAGVVAFWADPFTLAGTPVEEGLGLNPLLQNVQMLFHPPALYLGYLIFAVPFALVVGALLTAESLGEVLRRARAWFLGGWVMLTLGIVLGMQWAYVELGWGGYWSWDPVENASLVPWLAATATLHALALVRRGRLGPLWGGALVCITFVLCLLGALLARGGLVMSVHAFAASPMALPLLAVTVAALALELVALARGWRRAEGPAPLTFAGRDWLLALTACLLAGFGALVLVGTWWPAVSTLVAGASGPPGSVPVLTRAFYDRLAMPTGLALAGLLWGCALVLVGRRLRWVAGLVLAAGVGPAWLWVRPSRLGSIVAFVTTLLTVAAGFCLAVWVLRRLLERAGRDGSAARGRTCACWGLVHLGVALVLIGLALAEGFSRSERVTLAEGEHVEVVGLTVRLDRLDVVPEKRYVAHVARLRVSKGDRSPVLLAPALRSYESGQGLTAELALHTGLTEDVLASLTATGRDRAALTVRRRPGVLWVWVGGGLMVLAGGVLVWTAQRPRCSRPSSRAEGG